MPSCGCQAAPCISSMPLDTMFGEQHTETGHCVRVRGLVDGLQLGIASLTSSAGPRLRHHQPGWTSFLDGADDSVLPALPKFFKMHDVAAPCDAVGPNVEGVLNNDQAIRECMGRPACDFFVHVPKDRTLQVCRGRGFLRPTPSAGTHIGVRPANIRIHGAQTLLNKFGRCSHSQLLSQVDHVRDVEEAWSYCQADPECTHFSLELTGAQEHPGSISRMHLCRGRPDPVPRDGAVMVVDPERSSAFEA